MATGSRRRWPIVLATLLGGIVLVAVAVAVATGLAERVDGGDLADRRDRDRVSDVVPCGIGALRGDGTVLAVLEVTDGTPAPEACHGDSAVTTRVWSQVELLATDTIRSDLSAVAVYRDASNTVAWTVQTPGDRALVALHRNVLDDDVLLPLTVAHEFAHVIAARDDQLDATTPRAECGTWVVINGCLDADALLARWVDAFWRDDELAGIDPYAEPLVADGEDRCALDAGYLGPYAASHPEEDLAESFSAFVFDLEVPPAVEAKLAFFADVPEAVAVRDRARAAGLTPQPNVFEPCGG